MNRFLINSKDDQQAFDALMVKIQERYIAAYPKACADEDSLCATFMTILSEHTFEQHGLRFGFDSLKLRGRGDSADERITGADGIGIVRIRTDSVALNGYFLFQAKVVHSTARAMPRISEQCQKMVNISPSSFTLALTDKAVFFAPALAVISCKKDNPNLGLVPCYSLPTFILSHILRGAMLAPLDLKHIAQLAPSIVHVLTSVVAPTRDYENVVSAGRDEVTAAFSLDEPDLEIGSDEPGPSIPSGGGPPSR